MLSRGMGSAKGGISCTDDHDIAGGGKHKCISVLVAPETTGVCSGRKTRWGRRCLDAGLFRSKPHFPPVFLGNPAAGCSKPLKLPNEQAFSNVKSRVLRNQKHSCNERCAGSHLHRCVDLSYRGPRQVLALPRARYHPTEG